MALKVLHTGDWHIGNFPGPEINGENARFLDLCACLDKLAETAEQRRPDIVVISGDVFHQARVWSDRGLKESRTAISYIRRLELVAPVVVVRGTPNHDSEQQFEMLKAAFEGDGNVHVITEPKVVKIYTGAWGWVQVAGLPGFDRGVFRAAHPGLSREEETQVFTEALANIIIGLKAQCEPGVPTILSTHFTVTGCNMESGQTALFAQFEPVIEPATLAAAGFDLVALGHIHRPQPLPEAGNAFYCGSLMGLNFNDEAQERGFYLHEIDHGQVRSEYITTPYRAFQTVRLGPGNVEDINAGPEEGLEAFVDHHFGPFTGKIVRVLYSCSDADNKAFNKAALEDALYKAGAFWVSEITPETISASVNRDTLTGDNSPEENLAEYLSEKGIEPETAARMVDLARPIISETLEKSRTETSAGLFVPIEIEVHNYRNYRDEVFSYNGITFATINGENGAGKSSLFMDAMLDALYEQPREGDLTGWICNDPDVRSGSIKFTFALGGKTYRVTRTRTKSGKATLNIAEMIEGEWEDRSAERYRDTQAIIEQTIGMDSLTLKATGLIMQDQYGIFLQADKTDRMAILGNILGLGIYGSMEAASFDRAAAANRELRRITTTESEVRRSMPDREKVEKELREAQEARKGTSEELSGKKESADNLRFRLRTASEAAERAARATREINTLSDKKRGLTAASDAQVTVIRDAEVILNQREAIAAGVAEYHALEEREKGMIGQVALYDAKNAELDRVRAEIAQATKKNSRLKSELEAARQTEWSYRQNLSGEAALQETVSKAEAERARLTELERLHEAFLQVKDEYRETAARLEKETVEYSSERRRREGIIDDLKRRAAMLEDSGCPEYSPSCKFMRDAVDARVRIPEEERELSEYTEKKKAELDGLQKAKEGLREKGERLRCEDELNKQRTVVDGISRAEKELQLLAVQRERLDSLHKRMSDTERDISETTAAVDTMIDRVNDISREIEAIEEVKRSYDEITVALAAAKLWLEKEKWLPAAEERKAAAETRIQEISAEIREIEAQIEVKKAEQEKESYEASASAYLSQQIHDLEHEIANLERFLKTYDEIIGRCGHQLDEIKTAEERIAGLRAEAEAQGRLAADYEELKKAFSQDGIPHNIVRAVVPIIEATATNILGQMSGGRMSVEFVMEKTLKSNNKKEVTALDIIINDADTGALPYMSRSGGERVKAALSVILALSEIKSSTAGVQLGFLFIDEPPFLDDKGVQAYCDALEAIQRRYAGLKIMAITHDPEMKARFPQSVDVVKTAEGSKVICA